MFTRQYPKELLRRVMQVRLITQFTLFSVSAVYSQAAELTRPQHIQVSLRSLAPVYEYGSEVKLSLTLYNEGDNACQPIYLETGFSPIKIPNRAATVVELDVVGSDGRHVGALESQRSDSPNVTASDLFLFDCFDHYGTILSVFAHGLWRYDLRPDSYNVRARVIFTTKSYVMRHPPMFDEIAKVKFKWKESIPGMLPEGEYVSNWAEFKVIARSP